MNEKENKSKIAEEITSDTISEKKSTEKILTINQTEQYQTIDEMIKKSRAGSVYYTLLVISSFIIAPGLILGNASVVIGGMLVTPVLTPLLAFALGISIWHFNIIKDTFILLIKSFFVVLVVSFLMGLIFGQPQNIFFSNNPFVIIFLYFIIAVASGVAATFAWARKEISEVLPGVSIAVSLAPPLSLVGIWLSSFDYEITKFYFLVFIFNLLGIILGSIAVFSLLRFYKVEKRLEDKIM